MSKAFFEQVDEIDAMVQAGPSRFALIRQYFEHPQLQRYFFSTIKDPAWLAILVDEGFYDFERLPPGDRGLFWVRFYHLKRVAPQQPELTLQVIQAMPDQLLIAHLSDITEVATELPPHAAAALVPRLEEAVQRAERVSDADGIGRLVTHLSQGGEGERGLALLLAFLAVRPDGATAHDEPHYLPPTPQTLLASWEYKELLEATVPALLDAAPLETLAALCDLLGRAVRYSLRRPDDLDGFGDYSTIWRTQVAPNPEEYDTGPRDSLVVAVRDAAEQLARSGKLDVSFVVEHLEARRWPIFKRVALYLLTTLEGQGELADARLLDWRNFDAPDLRPEYNALLRARFGGLEPSARATILDWIDRGPDTEPDRRAYRAHDRVLSGEAIEDEIRAYVRLWQRRYLALLRPQLSDQEKQRFASLLAELSEADEVAPTTVTVGWVGPQSPKTADELNEMPVDDLVRYLKNGYEPSRDLMGDSPEGLGRQLQRAVGTSPGRYADEATRFADLALNPTYHVGLLRGLRDALKENRPFSWPPVVALAAWLVRQRDEQAHRYPGQVDGERDGFHGARLVLPDLLADGFTHEASPMPYGLRDPVWRVIERLARDPDPAPEGELKGFRDPATAAINAVRSESLSAAVRYGVWLKKQEEAPGHTLSRSSGEYARMWRLLDAHLDPAREPSLAVRSVYGRWLPWLERLDRGWVEANAPRLFPKAPEQRPWYEASWHTYLLFNAPYNTMLEPLSGEYTYATRHLGSEASQDGVTPEKRLAEHLLLFYTRGLIDLDAPESLIRLFYREAPLPLRRYALEFLGRILRNESATQEVFVERLVRLVDYRLAETTDYGEFEQLGWWIDAGAVPDAWKLATLRTVLPGLDKIEPLRRVLARLTELVERYPVEVLGCYEALAGVRLIGQKVHILREPTRKVLEYLVEDPNPQVRERAVSLAHEFGAMGLWELRDLTRSAAP